VYNLNYTPATLGVQRRSEITSGGMRKKKIEYHWTRWQNSPGVGEFLVKGSYEYDNDYSINMQIVSNCNAINRQFLISSPYGTEHLKEMKSLYSVQSPSAPDPSLIWPVCHFCIKTNIQKQVLDLTTRGSPLFHICTWSVVRRNAIQIVRFWRRCN
jgi:hypothetical protein